MTTRNAILLASTLVLVTLGAVATGAAREPWRSQQQAYQAAPNAGPLAAAQAVEVRQDRLLDYGEERIDRCRSCHVAVDDPAFKDGKEPLRTHASIAPHTFGELGCTICHEGDGRALTAALAHGEDHFWPEPLLEAPFIESSCARCHAISQLGAAAPHLRRGQALFTKYACVGCHTVAGLSHGNIGVELTSVGNVRKVDFLLKKLENPRFNVPQTLMPPFKIPEQDRLDLVTFLKSLRGRSIGEDPVSHRRRMKAWRDERPAELAETIEAGQKAIEARGCTSCHKLGQADGKLAPDLGHLGLTRDTAWVIDHLADPRLHVPGSSMPTFFMSAGERRAIATYLTSLKDFEVPAQPAEQYRALCARCHGEKGDGNGPVAETLLPRPRIFTNARFFNWLPEERAYRAIRDGVPGTAMPPFGKMIDEAQAKALFGYVRTTFIGEQRTEPAQARKLPERSPVAWTPESVARGKAAFLERCAGCHGRIGDGRGPNAPDMLPRPRNLTTRLFFAKLPDTRLYESITFGIVGTGMPSWDYLADDQRWDLVNYVRFLSSTGPAVAKEQK